MLSRKPFNSRGWKAPEEISPGVRNDQILSCGKLYFEVLTELLGYVARSSQMLKENETIISLQNNKKK